MHPLARADLNRDGRLSYEEFRALAPVLGLRVTAPLAVFVAIKMLLAPVLTLIPAYLILDDWPTERQLLGGVVMLVGIAFPLFRTRR